MGTKIEYVDTTHLYASKYIRNSKAIGVLWAIFTICYAIIGIVAFVTPGERKLTLWITTKIISINLSFRMDWRSRQRQCWSPGPLAAVPARWDIWQLPATLGEHLRSTHLFISGECLLPSIAPSLMQFPYIITYVINIAFIYYSWPRSSWSPPLAWPCWRYFSWSVCCSWSRRAFFTFADGCRLFQVCTQVLTSSRDYWHWRKSVNSYRNSS